MCWFFCELLCHAISLHLSQAFEGINVTSIPPEQLLYTVTYHYCPFANAARLLFVPFPGDAGNNPCLTLFNRAHNFPYGLRFNFISTGDPLSPQMRCAVCTSLWSNCSLVWGTLAAPAWVCGVCCLRLPTESYRCHLTQAAAVAAATTTTTCTAAGRSITYATGTFPDNLFQRNATITLADLTFPIVRAAQSHVATA